MCEYQFELRRIRLEIKEALERNETIHLQAKQRTEKGQELNEEKYESFCEGYGYALQRILRLIDKPETDV